MAERLIHLAGQELAISVKGAPTVRPLCDLLNLLPPASADETHILAGTKALAQRKLDHDAKELRRVQHLDARLAPHGTCLERGAAEAAAEVTAMLLNLQGD